MPRNAPRPTRSNQTTKLAALRLERDLTQRELALKVGIPIATYRRLERNELANPGVRTLSNLAIALGVELEDVIEDAWREWMAFDRTHASEPPPRPGAD